MRALRRLPGRPSMRPEQRDAAAAIGLLIGGLVMLPSGLRLGLSFGAALSLPTWLSVLIILLASTATRFRSTRPALSLPLALIAFLIDLTAGASLVTLIAVTDTSYAVARYGSRRLARTQLWMLGCGLPLFIAGGMIARTQLIDLLLGTLFLTTLFLLPIWWGTSLRLERDRTDLERQLGEGRLELLRSQQREETRAALAADRAVTGAELHDLVANQLAAIALRAEAAELGQAAGRAVTDTDLAAIAGASRSALRHLHDLIGLLREEPGVGVPERSADTLPGVLTQARALGSPVRWLGGDPEADGFAAALDAMPPEAGREILRILTEALVNAARHGADAEEGSGGVALRWLAGERTLSVTNAVREGRPPTAAGGGIGQRTMAERAARIGATIESGQLRAGEASAADGAPVRTWTVAITLPAPASAPGIARRADGAPGGEASPSPSASPPPSPPPSQAPEPSPEPSPNPIPKRTKRNAA